MSEDLSMNTRRFKVTTQERVEGTYIVEAGSAKAAAGKFGDPAIDWTGVEQQEYMAYTLEVTGIEEVSSDAS